MNIAEWLWRTAGREGHRPALMRGTAIAADYAGFRDRAGGVAAALAARGVGPGERVAIFAKNCPEYLVAMFGIWAAGAVAVPVNAKLHGREAAWVLGDASAKLVFVTGAEGQGLGAESDVAQVELGGADWSAMVGTAPVGPVSRRADDLAWLFYTSGTTGRPKGVCITHGMLAAVSMAYPLDVDEVRPGDAALYAAPMSHGAGLYAMIHVRMGAAHLVPESGGFDAGEVLDLARAHGSVSMFLAPTMVRRLVDTARVRGGTGEGIRTIVYGGGPMYLADIVEAVDLMGPRFVQIYGQGECPMGITALGRDEVADRNHPRWRERLMSVGRAQSPVEVAISDGAGSTAAPGEAGEIMVRGLPVMPGYWQNPEASAKTVVDGWLMTGDVGRLDGDGYLTLVDRSKDVIISGGSNIYPREVEEVLLEHPAVREVSVVGRSSAEWGEEVVAFVVGHAEPAELDAFCLERIARFKRPKDYVFVDELPKNAYGKVLKTDLRGRLD